MQSKTPPVKPNAIKKDLNKFNYDHCIYHLARSKVSALEDFSFLGQVKNRYDKILATNSEVFEQWRKHFDEISALKFGHPLLPTAPKTQVPSVTCTEFTAVVKMTNESGRRCLERVFAKYLCLQDLYSSPPK